jgi:hypothetical protein
LIGIIETFIQFQLWLCGTSGTSGTTILWTVYTNVDNAHIWINIIYADSHRPANIFGPIPQVTGVIPVFGSNQSVSSGSTNPFQPTSSSVRGRKILKPVRRLNRELHTPFVT